MKVQSGPILESNNMHVIFQKKGKKLWKKGKIIENLDKNVQNLKIFWKKAGYTMYTVRAYSSSFLCAIIASKKLLE